MGNGKMKRLLIVLLTLLPAAAGAEQVYVSALRGDDAGSGSRQQPFRTLETAIGKMKSGDTCFVMPGLYEVESLRFEPEGIDFEHPTVFRFLQDGEGRAVFAAPGGKQPRLSFSRFTRIEGLWAGGQPSGQTETGKIRVKGGMVAFGNEGVQIVGCTFFGEGLQLLAGNTARNCLIRDNRLVHMGAGWFAHPIYLSGGPPPTSQDIRVIGNTFIEGMGFALHAWHKPERLTIVGNFTAGHSCALVAQGPGHIIHHNFFWKPRGKTTNGPQPDWKWCAVLPNEVLRFDHNMCWSTWPVREEGTSRSEPVFNYTMPGHGGSQMKLIEIQPAEIPEKVTWLPRMEQQIDTAAKTISDYFDNHAPGEMAMKSDPELEAAFATVKVKYEPTESDLMPRSGDSGGN
jgi:hypothetical protein